MTTISLESSSPWSRKKNDVDRRDEVLCEQRESFPPIWPIHRRSVDSDAMGGGDVAKKSIYSIIRFYVTIGMIRSIVTSHPSVDGGSIQLFPIRNIGCSNSSSDRR